MTSGVAVGKVDESAAGAESPTPQGIAMHLNHRLAVGGLLLSLPAVTASSVATAEPGARPALAEARAATAAFHDADAARAAGYGPFPEGVPLHECITAPNPEHGAMGFHWLNPGLVDAELDPTRPEVLVYAPTADGGLRLVAMEYVVFADAWDAAHPRTTPSLFGRELTLVDSPNRFGLPAFHQLHTWVWRHNPHGMFEDHNTRVSCD